MSKSLGNSPDPLDLIQQYGADGVRTGMLFSSPAGNDLLFDEKLVEQGRNFANKTWNAFRLTQSWDKIENEQPSSDKLAILWFESAFSKALLEMEDHFLKFRISDALHTLYKLVWDDLCSWYLEWIKPTYGAPINKKTYDQTVHFFENVLRLMHPFMPFISEEIWHSIRNRSKNEYLIVSAWPKPTSINSQVLADSELLFQLITQIRNIRNQNQLSPKEPLPLIINGNESIYQNILESLQKMAMLTSVTFSNEKPNNCYSFVIQSHEFYIETEGGIDAETEKINLVKELEYARGFLASVEKKLYNEKFVSSAPAQVVATEKKKQEDALAKIKTLEDSLARF